MQISNSHSPASRSIAVLFLAIALAVNPASAQVEPVAVYPVGARLSMPVEPEVVVDFAAEGPSVLWVSVSAPALARVSLWSDDGMIAVSAVDGRAEAAFPVHRTGKIRCKILSARSGGRIIAAAAYGIGAEVSAEEIAGSVQRLAMTPTPVETPMTEKNVLTPAEISIAADTTHVAPASSEVLQETPAMLTPIEVSPIVAVSSPMSLMFGVGVHRVFPGNASSEAVVHSYRVYVPNRTPFRVSTAGAVDIRVQSESLHYDRSNHGPAELKEIVVETPDADYYQVHVRGEGEYVLRVERR